MFFKSVLIVILFIKLSECRSISNNIPYCKSGNDEEHGKHMEIDCQGHSMHGEMCNYLQTDPAKNVAVNVIGIRNCEIHDIGEIIPNFAVNNTKMVFVENNTLLTTDFSSINGLNLLMIVGSKFKTATPSSLNVNASNLKWFEFDGEGDKVVDGFTMTNATDLVFFSMENTSVSSFPANLFEKSGNLRIVRVPSNKLESVDSINWPHSVKWLDLSGNKMTHLSNKSFENLGNLQRLLVKENSIDEIEPGTFSELSNLMYLSMEKNHLKTIKNGSFDGLTDLRIIDLDENQIENIEFGAFEATPKLSVLNLSKNKIGRLDQNTFNGTKHLATINLSRNPIYKVAVDTFAKVPQLSSLDLSYCKLRSVDFNTFANTWNLYELDLSHNKIYHLVKMSSSQSTKTNNVPSEPTKILTDPFKWIEPIEKIGQDFTRENLEHFFNEVRMDSIAIGFASEFLDANNEELQLENLNLAANQLSVIENDIFTGFKNLDKLSLSKNPITILYPDSFAGLDALTDLSIDKCKLTWVDFSIFGHLTKLENLDLSFNQLTTITAALMPSVEKLFMNDNQLTSFPMQKNHFPNLIEFNVQNNNLVCSAMDTFVDINFHCSYRKSEKKMLKNKKPLI